MGEVRAGNDVRLGRSVAIKTLRRDLAEVDGVRRRFETEARAAATLAHPNVVAVFDIDEDDGVPFLVMEQLPGDSLADEIGRGPLSVKAARELGMQVLAALQAAHEARLVHRDVKPSNVLRASDGTWKVADFGIAKSTEAVSELTATGTVLGTPAYMAPERLEGHEATPASDLYSVGVVLYESVSGRRPFVADTPVALAYLIQTAEARPLRDLAPSADVGLVEVVAGAMHKDPSQRFNSAAEMRAALATVRGPADRWLASTVAIRAPLERGDETETRPAPTVALPNAARAQRHRPRWARWALIGIIAVVGALVLARLVAGNPGANHPVTATTTTATSQLPPATGSSQLPASLDRALKHLEGRVRR
jgi:eukaryotic-like serine/threonine-protein kinase